MNRRLVVGAAALASTAAVSLAGCSSSAKTETPPPTTDVTITVPVTTTTMPPPPTAAQRLAVPPYLRGKGAKLLEFLVKVRPLVGPQNPSLETCRNMQKVLPTIMPAMGPLLKVADETPDPALAKMFHTNIFSLNLLVVACSVPTTQLADAPMQYVRSQYGMLLDRLGKYGIKL